jgi:hypothetical protein
LDRAGDLGIRAANFDSDTLVQHQTIRFNGEIVVAITDMLHPDILPHHSKWARLFENPRYVAIDEIHSSTVADNVDGNPDWPDDAAAANGLGRREPLRSSARRDARDDRNKNGEAGRKNQSRTRYGGEAQRTASFTTHVFHPAYTDSSDASACDVLSTLGWFR